MCFWGLVTKWILYFPHTHKFGICRFSFYYILTTSGFSSVCGDFIFLKSSLRAEKFVVSNTLPSGIKNKLQLTFLSYLYLCFLGFCVFS